MASGCSRVFSFGLVVSASHKARPHRCLLCVVDDVVAHFSCVAIEFVPWPSVAASFLNPIPPPVLPFNPFPISDSISNKKKELKRGFINKRVVGFMKTEREGLRALRLNNSVKLGTI